MNKKQIPVSLQRKILSTFMSHTEHLKNQDVRERYEKYCKDQMLN